MRMPVYNCEILTSCGRSGLRLLQCDFLLLFNSLYDVLSLLRSTMRKDRQPLIIKIAGYGLQVLLSSQPRVQHISYSVAEQIESERGDQDS